MIGRSELVLPPWARVSDERRAHIARVTALLAEWSERMQLAPAEGAAWRDAGLWHDALRDAPLHELEEWVKGDDLAPELMHGPAAAARLAKDGETRGDVLEAIRWHTIGSPQWHRVGQALYMADFLEPGRDFARKDRAFLAAHVTRDFAGVFRQVVKARVEWVLREGHTLRPETVALWNAVR